MDYDAKYVSAKFGLTMRAEGRADAAKIGVIPFGVKVVPTYRTGEKGRVVALPSASYDWGGEVLKSDAYVMDNCYIEVVSGQDTGYVYDGIEPETLTIEEDGTLFFADAMSGVRIYVVGKMLFIYSEGGC